MAKPSFTIAATGGNSWKLDLHTLGRTMRFKATPDEVAALSDALLATKPADRYKKAFELTK